MTPTEHDPLREDLAIAFEQLDPLMARSGRIPPDVPRRADESMFEYRNRLIRMVRAVACDRVIAHILSLTPPTP